MHTHTTACITLRTRTTCGAPRKGGLAGLLPRARVTALAAVCSGARNAGGSGDAGGSEKAAFSLSTNSAGGKFVSSAACAALVDHTMELKFPHSCGVHASLQHSR